MDVMTAAIIAVMNETTGMKGNGIEITTGTEGICRRRRDPLKQIGGGESCLRATRIVLSGQ